MCKMIMINKDDKRFNENYPHIKWNDLRVVFADNGITIKNGVVENLLRFADKPQVNVMPMGNIIPFAGSDIYIVNVKDSDYGAVALLETEVFRKLADKLDSDLYILPSSVYEVLVVEANVDTDVQYLRDMVKDINNNGAVMKPEDILGYEVYRYWRELDTITIA